MVNATIALEYLMVGAAVLLLFFWNPRITFALFKAAFFLAFYIIVISVLYRWPEVEATREAHLLGSLAIPLGVLSFSAIIFAIVAYFIDRDFDKSPQDHFKGNTLFFRYGRKAFEAVIPIGLEEGATEEDAESLMERFREYIWNTLKEQFGGLKEVALKQDHIVKDLGWGKEDSYHYRHGEKDFFKASFQTARKSTLYYFICFNTVGRQLLVHHYIYLRGRHYWYHALVFFAAAPFHVWFWGYSWVAGRYSILGRLNRYYDPSSYDLIDLKSYFGAVGNSMLMATKRFAKVYGLLTEELERAVMDNMSHFQRTDIRGSRRISVGKIRDRIKG